jgi:ATP-dependent helicase Lhr and Lhr-like helicase
MPNEAPLRGTGASAFERLAPFIQDFIWQRGWTEMREIQARAIAAAFDTDRHLLLAAGTASGKTEAAFLPILTQLHEDPPQSVGALYIGPLKALINDQFLRLGDLCVEADIPVTAWHGDVSASKKQALLKQPRGILQITPEALEGLLLNRSSSLMRMFGDLRWVVIDEVHAFMASDRGGQVLSLLDRLTRFALDQKKLPRRVGLSATLGDYGEAAAWLDGVTGRGVEVIADRGGREVYLLVDHFIVRPPGQPANGDADEHEAPEAGLGARPESEDTALADRLIARQEDLFRAAYSATQKRKSLVFTNSRADAEEVITALRRMAEREHGPDIYHVHHGSIAAPLREAAETAMRDGEGPACTAATVTLELGIDLGQLDRVLQLGPTSSVASFLQRLGRAGRRGQRPEMFFLLRAKETTSGDSVLARMPWELLQTIALIQLYAEDKWVEPIARPTLPGSLLYQQTMSIVGAAGELQPHELAARVLTLAPFRSVTQEDFRSLLRHLIEIDHLERTDSGSLMLGLAGEKVVRSFRFLATFKDTTEWAVKEGARDIGTIGDPLPVGERFVLAGRMWEVVDLIAEQRIIGVKRVRGSLKTRFLSNARGEIHDRVVERMRRVLVEDERYPYLTDRAMSRLADARALAHVSGLATGPVLIPLGGQKSAVVPWCGSKRLRTMTLRLGQALGISQVKEEGFFIVLTQGPEESGARLESMLAAVGGGPWSGPEMAAGVARPVMDDLAKYNVFLPDDLLKRTFVADHLDVTGARERFRDVIGSRTEPGPEPLWGAP